jgi:16S rRNA (adenine1518-N6/adenine1519-N6)-dimethyltransferase
MTSPNTLLKAHRLVAKKQLGQNFLTDPGLACQIVALANLASDDAVLEVGAGLGMLTAAIARQVRRVWAVETDGRIISLLKSELSLIGLDHVAVVKGDFLRLHLDAFEDAADRPLVVMGNLPYNISSQILVRLIQQRRSIERAILMFQKEMAERLVAQPGKKSYGRLTVMLGYCARVERLKDYPARHFFPRPKIDSSIVEVRFCREPVAAALDEPFLFQTIKAAFAQRRKTLKNALRGSFLKPAPEAVNSALTVAGIDPRRRAETLDPVEFVRLANALYTATVSPPS